ncbi:MAG TPA: delta-60 repeat domain-containing protein [Rugosimonospora sp.]|nr:delta-60 repeat domain-containing protein [Rugosimonospora sp.]
MRRGLLAAFLTAATAVLAAVTVPAALADQSQPAVVSANPVDYTPNILDGTVLSLALVGRTVVVGGDFDQVAAAGSPLSQVRYGIFGYDLYTGALTGFAPQIDGPVNALAAGPGDTVYVGGRFSKVNGVAQRGLAQLDLSTGQRVPGFKASLDSGDVRTLAYAHGWLYAGGSFSGINGHTRTALARLNPATGALDSGLDLRLTAPHTAPTRVYDLSVSPDGSKLVAIGAIEAAGGQPRAQLLMASIGAAGVSLSGWYTDAYRAACDSAYDTYLRAVDFSPHGDYFVVVSTGKLTGPGMMCDSAARFEATGTGAHGPTWVNYTGGNSLFAVDVTGAAVYVGGHEQWLDNPYGDKYAGPGAVYRPGIGAINPVTGKALSWNPTRTRGVGVRAFLACSAGLIVGSDTDQLGHEYHGRIGMFPPG